MNNPFVGRFRLRCDSEHSIMAVPEKVKAKMPDTVVVGSAPRHSSARNGLPRTLRYDTQGRGKNGSYAKLGMLAMNGEIFGILCHEIRTRSGWHHTLQGRV